MRAAKEGTRGTRAFAALVQAAIVAHRTLLPPIDNCA